MTTLLKRPRRQDGCYGIHPMCVAGGMGHPMLVERLS
jgi:acetyl-CoA acetyltransferase